MSGRGFAHVLISIYTDSSRKFIRFLSASLITEKFASTFPFNVNTDFEFGIKLLGDVFKVTYYNTHNRKGKQTNTDAE